MKKAVDILYWFDSISPSNSTLSLTEAAKNINVNNERDLPIEVNNVLQAIPDNDDNDNYKIPANAILVRRNRDNNYIVDMDDIADYMGSNSIYDVDEAVSNIAEANDILTNEILIGVDKMQMQKIVEFAKVELAVNNFNDTLTSVSIGEAKQCDGEDCDDDEDKAAEFVPKNTKQKDVNSDTSTFDISGEDYSDTGDEDLDESYFTNQLKAYGTLMKNLIESGYKFISI